MVFYALPAHSRELSSLQIFKPLLAYEPYALSELPENPQLHFSTAFAPLYSQKDRATDGDSQNVAIRAHGFSAGLFSRCEQFRYYLSCSRDDLEAMSRQRGEDYYLVNHRKEWNVASGAAYRRRNLLIGFGLGRHLPEGMEREHLREIREDPENYLLRGPWQLSFDVKVDFANAAARLSLFSGPVHSSLSKLVTSDGTGYRAFPVSIIRHRIDAGVDVHSGSFYASSLFGIDYFENSDLQTVRNRMPQDIAISNYRLEHQGRVRLPITDSLGWSVSGSMAGGWIAGYNFDRDRFTFFKSDALRLHTLIAGVGAELPGSMIAGLSQTFSKAATPSGFLRLSAMSAWSVFQPHDYRYADAAVTYHETGGFINRRFGLSCFEFMPQLYFSYIAAKMALSSSHKEIVVLLPVYVDTMAMEFFNNRLLLFEPSLSVLARLGRIHISGSMYQDLPYLIASGKTVDPGKPEPRLNNDRKIIGGTRFSLSAIWYIPVSGNSRNNVSNSVTVR